MNTRLIIALILSMLAMLVWQLLFFKPQPQKSTKGKEVAVTEEVKEETTQEGVSPPVPIAQPGPRKGVTYQDVVVETPLYTATFTTYGGRLTSWKLQNYMDKVPLHPLGRFVQNLAYRVKSAFGFKGKKVDETPPQAVDIVTTTDMADAPLGISFSKGRIGYDEGIPFVPSSRKVTLTRQGEEQTVTLRWRSPRGEQIEKRFTFYADTYHMDMEVIVSPPPDQGSVEDTLELTWTAEIPEDKKRYGGFFGPIYYTDGAYQKEKPKKIKKEGKVVRETDWFGFNQYYFIALIDPSTEETVLRLDRDPEEEVIHSVQLTPLELRPGDKDRVSYTLFLGPKDSHLLSQITPTATKAARYGFLHVLAVPIVWFLNFTNTFTGNYGLDIIIMAILLKILFTPLTHKSQQSMKEMQKLQPEIKKLQQKYKDDKQTLQRETMELYKRRKINPLGGCLPLLLQMPVFFALYQAFLGAIELRHAPFILWIRDLSDKDPTYITPLLMGATMFLQQKMSTVTADPAQMKMMTFMPIIFTFIFLNFPCGLVIYWFVTNILAIGHQCYINQME